MVNQVCGMRLNSYVWTVSLWTNVKGILTSVSDSFIIIKDFELFLIGKSEFWNDTKRCLKRRKCNEDATDPGSRWFWTYSFIFSWTFLQHCLSAFHLFSLGDERYCREIDALCPLHEVPDWNTVPPSDHRGWLPLAIAHITDMRRLTTGIHYEKCVIRRFRCRANVYLHKI